MAKEEWAKIPNASVIHYTRKDPDDAKKEMS